MSKIIKLSRLRVGQRFSFVPSQWFGQCRLLSKTKRETGSLTNGYGLKWTRMVTYDIKFDARVVNPPGVMYGVAANTRVRLLKPKKEHYQEK